MIINDRGRLDARSRDQLETMNLHDLVELRAEIRDCMDWNGYHLLGSAVDFRPLFGDSSHVLS